MVEIAFVAVVIVVFLVGGGGGAGEFCARRCLVSSSVEDVVAGR